MTDAPHEEVTRRPEGDRPPLEMRLRSTRAPVTRLSRKVLTGLGVVAAARHRRRPVLRPAAAP